MISLNVLESSRKALVKKVFYASSACIYPDFLQNEEDNQGLQEHMAWPAKPQDAYGLEKLSSEELHMYYAKDFDIQTRIGRFHNIYGPFGTWKGGREKAPAAICRKIIVNNDEIEIWGDGKQKRSFLYIDDCVEGIIRLMDSDYTLPLNIGSEEMVSINQMIDIISTFDNKHLHKKYIDGPQGVRGRNSDNTLTRFTLNWDYTYTLQKGLKITYDWIKSQIQKEIQNNQNISQYYTSDIIKLKI